MKKVNLIITITICLNVTVAYTVFEEIDRRSKLLDYSFMSVFENVPTASRHRTGFNRSHITDHFIFKLPKLRRQPSPSFLSGTLKKDMVAASPGYKDNTLNHLNLNVSNLHWDDFKLKEDMDSIQGSQGLVYVNHMIPPFRKGHYCVQSSHPFLVYYWQMYENTMNLHFIYKSIFNKSYSSAESEVASRSAWLDNLKAISEHNHQHLAGKHTYSLDLNHFTDLFVRSAMRRDKKVEVKTTARSNKYGDSVPIAGFMKSILRLVNGPLIAEEEIHHEAASHPLRRQGHPRGGPLPEAVDWRSMGYRPRLERQLSCGSCYAFSIAHALQAQLFKAHGDWHDLSAQQIVDCSGKYGNHGCHGGSLRAALRYISKDGLEYDRDYRYHAKVGKCHRSAFARKVKPKRWAMVPEGHEDELARVVAYVGPVPVSLDASKLTFQFYRSGIYDDPTCSRSEVNHAVLAVGYTKDYWILMNWWGKSWGEHGYMRLRRGVNRCGIANIAAYVQL